MKLRDEMPAQAFQFINEKVKEKKVPALRELTDMGVLPGLAQILTDHVQHLTSLTANGKLISGGPCDGFEDAINIFEAKSDAEARALHDADPIVKAGFMSIQQVFCWRQVF
ncbi:MAG: YciI family protein [Immundisolibacter sp.]|uniref:YciI family protein n=1 Tax=Immundisolibacter sp. TaxID=1934948 RepID=UPI003EDFBF97